MLSEEVEKTPERITEKILGFWNKENLITIYGSYNNFGNDNGIIK